jgi:hypothetical protein
MDFADPILNLMLVAERMPIIGEDKKRWVLSIFDEAIPKIFQEESHQKIAKATAPSLVDALHSIYWKRSPCCYLLLMIEDGCPTEESIQSVSAAIAEQSQRYLVEGDLTRLLHLSFTIPHWSTLRPAQINEARDRLAAETLVKALPDNEALQEELSLFIPPIFGAMQKCDAGHIQLYTPRKSQSECCDCCVIL